MHDHPSQAVHASSPNTPLHDHPSQAVHASSPNTPLQTQRGKNVTN